MINLDYNLRNLLELLLKSNKTLTIEELQNNLKMKKRTVYNVINKINEELNFNGINSIKNIRGEGYYIQQDQKEIIANLLNFSDVRKALRPIERVRYLICWLIYPKEKVNVSDIADCFMISKNTVFNDLCFLKDEIKKHNLKLSFDIKMGYKISGKAMQNRVIFLYYFKLLLSGTNINSIHFLNMDKVYNYYERLLKISAIMKNDLDKNDLISLAALLNKVENIDVKFNFSLLEFKDLINTDELNLIDQYFQDLRVHERLYLSIQLLGTKASKTIKIADNEDDILLLKNIQNLVNSFEKKSLIYLVDKLNLINSLYIHFKLSIHYHRLSIQIANPLIEQVKNQYSELYNIVKSICEDYANVFPFPLNESEIVYITMHFGGHIRKSGIRYNKKIRVLVVCPSGISTSTLLKREISNLYYNVKVVASTTENNIEKYIDNVDFIVSTVDLNLDFPWIKVNPILNNEDKSRIASLILLNNETYETNKFKLESFFNIINKYIPDEKMPEFKKDFYRYLRDGNVIIDINKNVSIRLSELLDIDNIQIIDKKLDWRSSIKMASIPLINKYIIRNEYVDAMIKMLEKYGNYIILKNMVAISHAMPSQGANKLGISLMINKTPIDFDGKMVKFLFVLSNPDQHNHLRLLKDIVNLSSSKDVLESLLNYDSNKTVHNIIKKYIFTLEKPVKK